MDVLETITARRSTRRFHSAELSQECIRQIISSGMCAPSPKNTQPWHFIVVQKENEKNKIADILEAALKRLECESERAKIVRQDIKSAFSSVHAIRGASAVIFVFMDPPYHTIHDDGIRWALCAKDAECTHIMSIGAAIENMLLAATALGIDSLWICDIYYAYNDILGFLGAKGCMMAAVVLGHGSSESKATRKELEKVVVWR